MACVCYCTYCKVAASKCHLYCSIIYYCNHVSCCCYYMFLPVCVNVCMYMSVVVFDIIASNCRHCCSVNFTVTICNVAYAAPPFLKRKCHSTGRQQELDWSVLQQQSRPPVEILQIAITSTASRYVQKSLQDRQIPMRHRLLQNDK